MNSRDLDGKKLNLNTFIRKAPPSSSEQKIHGFLFLKEFTSVCVLFVIFFQLIVAFGYILLSFYLLPASQLFQVPFGQSYYLAFNSVTRPCVLTQATLLGRVLILCLWLLPFRKRLVQQRENDTVMSLRSS